MEVVAETSRRRTRVGKEEESAVSSAEENMALARHLMEARVEGDLDALDEMLAPDFVTHTKLVPGQPPGRKGEKWAISQLNAALSNRSIHFEDQIAAGDKVVSGFVVHVTHDRGELIGVAPSGKVMTNKIIMIHRIEVGKIAEEWGLGTLGLKLRGVRLEQEWRERECVDQELRVARRIQQASLPKTVPTLEGWRISPFYQPAREVGGDFYDFHLLSEGRVGLVVGDATGKGVPAALVSPTATSSTPMSRLAGCGAPTGRLSVVSPK
jgi:ketosteroid isomerase-like protein